MAMSQEKISDNESLIEFPMNEKHWAKTTDNVDFLTYKAVAAVQSSDKNDLGIMLKGFDFTNGTIEFDVEFKGRRSFPSIDFRIDKDTLNSEKFYIRYFGVPDNIKRTTAQYAAVIDGVNMWDVTDEYQGAATLYEGQWNHVKLVVHGKQMKVYINDMQQSTLHVSGLEGITKSGSIALGGNAIFANFIIRPNAISDLSPYASYDPTESDTRYLKNWYVSEAIDFPIGNDVMQGIKRFPFVNIDANLLDSTTVWTPIKADRRALVNLIKHHRGMDQGQRKLTWLKMNITSESNQEKRIDLGFSDEVWVFINGQPLLVDKNLFGTPSMKEPRGRCSIDNTSFKLPLTKGDNEILIGVSNYFYAWGIIARINNTDGLKFK